ncbi:MFS general substrate transporter, partial [Fistulina hepatica ATCC 64428]
FGVFEEYYSSNLLANRSLNDISWIGSLQLCLILLIGCISGPLFDAGHFKSQLAGGGALYIFCLFMTSISTEYYQILLSQGLGVGLAQGIIFTPALSCLGHHFKQRRTLAFGVFAAGASTGGTLLPIALYKLFPKIGFAWTVRILAFIILCCLVCGLVFCSTRLPPRTGGRILDIRVFVSSCLGIPTHIIFSYLPLSYGVTYASDHGLSPDMAFYSLSILNACSIIGRVIPNLIAQKVGPINVLLSSCAASSVALYAWLAAKSDAGIIVFNAIYGVLSGAYVSGLPAAGASLANDPNEIGLRLGMMFFCTSFFWLVSSPIQGALINVNGQYWPAVVFSGTAVVVGVLSLLGSRHLAARMKGTHRV